MLHQLDAKPELHLCFREQKTLAVDVYVVAIGPLHQPGNLVCDRQTISITRHHRALQLAAKI
jgi:hypothetical protein